MTVEIFHYRCISVNFYLYFLQSFALSIQYFLGWRFACVSLSLVMVFCCSVFCYVGGVLWESRTDYCNTPKEWFHVCLARISNEFGLTVVGFIVC